MYAAGVDKNVGKCLLKDIVVGWVCMVVKMMERTFVVKIDWAGGCGDGVADLPIVAVYFHGQGAKALLAADRWYDLLHTLSIVG